MCVGFYRAAPRARHVLPGVTDAPPSADFLFFFNLRVSAGVVPELYEQPKAMETKSRAI